MLNKEALREEIKRNAIYVDNSFSKLNENCIDISLGDTLKVYDAPSLKIKDSAPVTIINIPEEGLILVPGKLYIGATSEFTKTYGFVPILTGTDELAVLGMKTHITAGFGDNGFEGTWTLEIECAMPVRVYPNMRVGSIYYNPLIGGGSTLYRGKYFNQVEPTMSRLYEEYDRDMIRRRVL